MKNTTHRVVILKNIDSQIISQAILILKDTASGNESAVMLEAEQIVQKYMEKSPTAAPPGRKKIAGLLSAGIILLGIGVFILAKLT